VIAARQRHHVRVVIFVEEEITEIQRVPHIEIGAAAAFAVSTFCGDLLEDTFPLSGFQTDQLRAYHCVIHQAPLLLIASLCIVAGGSHDQISTSLA
jgi:hypothetical protein